MIQVLSHDSVSSSPLSVSSSFDSARTNVKSADDKSPVRPPRVLPPNNEQRINHHANIASEQISYDDSPDSDELSDDESAHSDETNDINTTDAVCDLFDKLTSDHGTTEEEYIRIKYRNFIDKVLGITQRLDLLIQQVRADKNPLQNKTLKKNEKQELSNIKAAKVRGFQLLGQIVRFNAKVQEKYRESKRNFDLLQNIQDTIKISSAKLVKTVVGGSVFSVTIISGLVIGAANFGLGLFGLSASITATPITIKPYQSLQNMNDLYVKLREIENLGEMTLTLKDIVKFLETAYRNLDNIYQMQEYRLDEFGVNHLTFYITNIQVVLKMDPIIYS